MGCVNERNRLVREGQALDIMMRDVGEPRLVDVDPARPEVPLVAADVQPKRGFRRCCRGGEQHREKPVPRHATGMMLFLSRTA